MTFVREQRSRGWQIFMEIGANILASKFLKMCPPDYPKDVTCLKHLPKCITGKETAFHEKKKKKCPLLHCSGNWSAHELGETHDHTMVLSISLTHCLLLTWMTVLGGSCVLAMTFLGNVLLAEWT